MTRYLLGIRNLDGFLDSFVSCRTEQKLGWAGASIVFKEIKNLEFSLQVSKFYCYLDRVADILFLGVCGSSMIGSNLESTLIR